MVRTAVQQFLCRVVSVFGRRLDYVGRGIWLPRDCFALEPHTLQIAPELVFGTSLRVVLASV